MSFLFRITILALLLSVPFLSFAKSSQKIKDGLWLESHIVNTGQNSYELTVVKVDLNHFKIKPYYSETADLVFNMATKSKALLMVNANFFDTNKKPLGLVKIDNKVITPKKNISWWSVFCIKNNKAEIIHSSVVKNGYCEQAVQAGPRLVTSGVIPKLKDESSRKTAIGIDRNGLVHFIVSSSRIPIKILASFLQKSVSRGGLGLIQALNLDGGSSTQMYFQYKEHIKAIPSVISVPVGLGIFEQQTNK